MKKNILLLAFLVVFIVGCAHHKKISEKEIDQHCQDLNVLYQKKFLIEANIANMNTTRTPEGGYYKRQFAEQCKDGFCQIKLDDSQPILKYEPKHPDANKHGYVAYPNINLNQEKKELEQWNNIQKNLMKFAPVKNNFFLKDERANKCFEKYSFVDENFNYRKYLGR